MSDPAPKPTNVRQLRRLLRRARHWVRLHVPPGLRLVLGFLLMVGGIFGFLPVLGFWMIPLGFVIAMMDIRPIYRALKARMGPPRE